MGADYPRQEVAIQELRCISDDAREYLSHHLRNALGIIINAAEVGNMEMVVDAAWHAVADLERIGC